MSKVFTPVLGGFHALSSVPVGAHGTSAWRWSVELLEYCHSPWPNLWFLSSETVLSPRRQPFLDRATIPRGDHQMGTATSHSTLAKGPSRARTALSEVEANEAFNSARRLGALTNPGLHQGLAWVVSPDCRILNGLFK